MDPILREVDRAAARARHFRARAQQPREGVDSEAAFHVNMVEAIAEQSKAVALLGLVYPASASAWQTANATLQTYRLALSEFWCVSSSTAPDYPEDPDLVG